MAENNEIPTRLLVVLAGVGLLVGGMFFWMEFAVDRTADPLRDRERWSEPVGNRLSSDLPLDMRGNDLMAPEAPPPPPVAGAPTSQGM